MGRIRYRLSLVVVLPLLVFITGGAIALRTFVTTRATVDSLTDDLFRSVAAQAVVRTQSEILRAAPSVELASSLRASGAVERAAMLRQFLAILKANPGFSWVSFSDDAGRFIGVHRTPEGVFRDNQSEIVDGKTRLVERDLQADGTWKVHREVPDSGYDPRTRAFYKLAAETRRRAFTPPYVFFEQAVPGITRFWRSCQATKPRRCCAGAPRRTRKTRRPSHGQASTSPRRNDDAGDPGAL